MSLSRLIDPLRWACSSTLGRARHLASSRWSGSSWRDIAADQAGWQAGWLARCVAVWVGLVADCYVAVRLGLWLAAMWRYVWDCGWLLCGVRRGVVAEWIYLALRPGGVFEGVLDSVAACGP